MLCLLYVYLYNKHKKSKGKNVCVNPVIRYLFNKHVMDIFTFTPCDNAKPFAYIDLCMLANLKIFMNHLTAFLSYMYCYCLFIETCFIPLLYEFARLLLFFFLF